MGKAETLVETFEANLRVGVKADPAKIYAALTEPRQLAKWWTSDTRGNGTRVGDTLQFFFRDGTFCQQFKVTALEPNRLVRWTGLADGMEDWLGTEVSFELKPDTARPNVGQTYVRFRHSGWREKTDFFAHCSTHWAIFLVSLKDLMETGKGQPAPHEILIDHF
jgi:uncharacterized protein YndB with AHSA1/START domain